MRDKKAYANFSAYCQWMHDTRAEASADNARVRAHERVRGIIIVIAPKWRFTATCLVL